MNSDSLQGRWSFVWLLVLFLLPREHTDKVQCVHLPRVVLVIVIGGIFLLRPTQVLAPELKDGRAGAYDTILQGMGPGLAIFDHETHDRCSAWQ